MEHWLNKMWYQKHPLFIILLPASLVFYCLIALRKCLYQLSVLRSIKSSTPVIVIGNITVGGTGKTPLIIHLVEQFKQAGINVAVVSRGYGRDKSIKCGLVNNKRLSLQQGDEPTLIFSRTNAPVVVANKRTQACLFVDNNLNVDVILADDGLQHYAMARAVEWSVFDTQRGYGNKFLLPAGPLREPMSRLNKVDVVLSQNSTDQFEKNEIAFYLSIDKAYNLNVPKNILSLSDIASKNEHYAVMAAIGNPKRFFESMKNAGITGETFTLPDHHVFTKKDFEKIHADKVFITEKDAIKCSQFDLPNVWVVPVTLKTSPCLDNEIQQLIQNIQSNRLTNG